jgi:hypothetical protein
MQIYKGKLTLKKTTKKMLVYSSEELRAQYVPKALFKSLGLRTEPREITFAITTVDSYSQSGKRAHGKARMEDESHARS